MPRLSRTAARASIVAVLALTGAAAPTSAPAQVLPTPAAPQVTVGQRLRLGFHEESRTGALVGRLTQQDATHMSLDTRVHTWTLRWTQLRTIEVSHPRSLPAAAGRGAVVGALVFMSALAVRFIVHTPAAGDAPAPYFDDGGSVGAVMSRAALWGAGVGLVTGALLDRDRWEPVTMPEPAPR